MSPESQIPPEKVIARVAAGAALTIAAGNASSSLDKFSSWFLTAFGAGFTLIISQLKDVSSFIPLATVVSAAYMFLVAVVIYIVQYYIAMIILTGVQSAREASEIGEKHKHMDVQEFFAQMLQCVPCLVGKMVKNTFDALQKNDFAVQGRLFIRLTILQGTFATIEVILLSVALTKIIKAL